MNESTDRPVPIQIRTSDRNSFRRCRRRWGWSSHHRQYLEPIVKSDPLWLGTGFHYVLEDYHGYKRFKTPADALREYARATKTIKNGVPADYKELTELGVLMLDYYVEWLSIREVYPTLWIDGHPQCEVEFEIPLPEEFQEQMRQKYKLLSVPIVKAGKIDRVCIDPADDGLWIEDYKTAKSFATEHLDNDPQATAYSWAAYAIYDRPIKGMLWQQHHKTPPKEPRQLSSGKISADKSQRTSHKLYREALINLYGGVEYAPPDNLICLETLSQLSTEHQDPFVRRDFSYRNMQNLQSEGVKIMMETSDILNPELPLYPNPTKDCSWDCSFLNVCLAMDDGDDYKSLLDENYQKRQPEDKTWRSKIQYP